MDVYSYTEQKLKEYTLLEKGARIVAAVSGGPDSMALFHVLHRLAQNWDLHVTAAHVNHRFRIEESLREAQLVKDFANQLGRSVRYVEIDMPSYIEQTGENAQAAARKKRYEFFFQVCKDINADMLLMAHHADDQAETIFMRILKGASVKSLAGIPRMRTEKGITVVRPLLGLSKQVLLEYCHKHNIVYAKDSSNDKTDYFRNQIRLEVFPYLQKFQPQLTEALNRLGNIAAIENDWMESEAKQFIHRHAERTKDEKVVLDRKQLLKLHPALQKRVIPLILKYLAPNEQNYEYTTIESIYTAIQQQTPPSVQLHLPAGLQFCREYDKLYVRVKNNDLVIAEYCYELSKVPDKLELAEACWIIETYNVTGSTLSDRLHDKHQLYLDVDQLEQPLYVRSRRPGDRMRIYGMDGTKKVKDIFIDEKIPPSLRTKTPILVDGKGEIIWIAGVKYSGIGKPNRTSRNILHIISRPNIC